ncbi:MAG: FeoB-associated Cys-rich membrane protein [Chloroflexi bacterium]|jgi:hypothetical protein|nr:FeoB-associated Cys-rich membrane protein [Chloroflexota bacterium]
MSTGTIIVGLVLLAVVAWIIVRMVRQAKANTDCESGCIGCPIASRCAKGKDENLPTLPFTVD